MHRFQGLGRGHIWSSVAEDSVDPRKQYQEAISIHMAEGAGEGNGIKGTPGELECRHCQKGAALRREATIARHCSKQQAHRGKHPNPSHLTPILLPVPLLRQTLPETKQQRSLGNGVCSSWLPKADREGGMQWRAGERVQHSKWGITRTDAGNWEER